MQYTNYIQMRQKEKYASLKFHSSTDGKVQVIVREKSNKLSRKGQDKPRLQSLVL